MDAYISFFKCAPTHVLFLCQKTAIVILVKKQKSIVLNKFNNL
jgi:hypothetical protein